MKTSVVKVRDMLSVLSMLGVEKRIGEVPGVESVTVDFAAATATIRYDETRLNVADIRADVRQSGHESAVPVAILRRDDQKVDAAPSELPATPTSAAPKAAPHVARAEAASTAPAGDIQPDEEDLGRAGSTPAAGAPKPSPVAGIPSATSKTAPDTTAGARPSAMGDGQQDKSAHGKS